MRGTEEQIREAASVREDAVEYKYMLEEIKLIKIQIAAHEFRREIRTAEEDLQSSYAAEPGLTRLWSWRVSMIKEKLRILHQEHERQAEVVRKMRETG